MANLPPHEEWGQLQSFPQPSDGSLQIARIEAAVQIVEIASRCVDADLKGLGTAAREFLKREFTARSPHQVDPKGLEKYVAGDSEVCG